MLFLGVAAGAIGGGLAIGAVEALIKGPGLTPDVDMVEVVVNACFFGAMYGIVVAPLAWWTMLRAVPVWRGALETALASSFAASFTLPITIGNFWSAFAMAMVGAALATLRLRREFIGPD